MVAPVMATGVIGCGTTSGCASGAPELEAAAVVQGGLVSLAFSEAMAPPDAVNPHAFRLSRVVLESAGTTFFSACGSDGYGNDCMGPHYADLAGCSDYAQGAFYYNQHCEPRTATEDVTFYFYGEADVASGGHLEALSQPSATHLLGTLTVPLDVDCARTAAEHRAGGLYLHYADWSPPVTAASRERLAPIAAAYVSADGNPVVVHGLLPGHPVPVNSQFLGGDCDACTDGLRDGNESDVDCGGASGCERCATGQACTSNGDCASHACQSGTCITST